MACAETGARKDCKRLLSVVCKATVCGRLFELPFVRAAGNHWSTNSLPFELAHMDALPGPQLLESAYQYFKEENNEVFIHIMDDIKCDNGRWPTHSTGELLQQLSFVAESGNNPHLRQALPPVMLDADDVHKVLASIYV